MIKIKNTEVFGWEAAIRGMRNPMNSWNNSDSGYKFVNMPPCDDVEMQYVIGENDLELMKKLSNAGTDHGKFMRMINVTCDITAPLYLWKELDTYKVGTVANSCSTMHKIHEKKFELEDFSCEHLIDADHYELCDCLIDLDFYGKGDFSFKTPLSTLKTTIRMLNEARNKYLETKDKKFWWQMIQLLPSSYNQRRTVQLNYAVLKNMYNARKNHKLDEWHDFCHWIETLPYSELITGDDNE